jgi:hypothetical protein
MDCFVIFWVSIDRSWMDFLTLCDEDCELLDYGEKLEGFLSGFWSVFGQFLSERLNFVS